MRYTCFFIISILFLSCNQEADKPQKLQNLPKKEPQKTIFLIYGELAPTGYIKEQDSSITQKFGFCVKRITGCEVTPELTDSVKVINQKNNSLMQSKYGKDWIQKFEKETNMKLAIPDVE